MLTPLGTGREGRIASIGHDGLLCFWDIDGQETGHHKYPGTPAPVPHGLYYHHQRNLLAVSCNDGYDFHCRRIYT